MKPIARALAATTAVALSATLPMLVAGPAANAGSARAAAATVDMGQVLKAAQIDPRRTGETPTTGAKAAVTAVEQALQAKGLLAAKRVDGHFGTDTIAAYAKYQKSLGYSGLGATGLPGVASLRKLGTGRFTVTNVITPGARTTRDGKKLNARTEQMLTAAEKLLHRTLTLDQGSYNPGGDPTSAGTHDGGGVVDVHVTGLSKAARTAIVRALRQVGFAAWDRDPSQGDWPQHIHAAAISDPDLSAPAQHQIGDYYLGRNGLANHAPDDGPQVRPIRSWEEYQQAN